MKLSDICIVKTNFENADFYLARKGSVKTVGKPTKEFSPEHIGIKVKEEAKEIVLPEYLKYMMEYLFSKGEFGFLSKGTTNLVNISVEDVKNIRIQ
jgi:hypothetical protein